ncbi:hypothetical protein STENM223S_10976 [Streptomyces tendae]
MVSTQTSVANPVTITSVTPSSSSSSARPVSRKLSGVVLSTTGSPSRGASSGTTRQPSVPGTMPSPRCRTVTTGTPAARARSLSAAIAATVPAARWAMATVLFCMSTTRSAELGDMGSP